MFPWRIWKTKLREAALSAPSSHLWSQSTSLHIARLPTAYPPLRLIHPLFLYSHSLTHPFRRTWSGPQAHALMSWEGFVDFFNHCSSSPPLCLFCGTRRWWWSCARENKKCWRTLSSWLHLQGQCNYRVLVAFVLMCTQGYVKCNYTVEKKIILQYFQTTPMSLEL